MQKLRMARDGVEIHARETVLGVGGLMIWLAILAAIVAAVEYLT